jgi:transcriptional regulator with XRE-family HTH domain
MSRTNLTEARTRFARRLKSIRGPKGYRTARSFARALDIDENRYTRYERGEVEPSLDLLLRICELLGATPNDLLCDYIGTPANTPMAAFHEDRGFSEFGNMPHSGMVAASRHQATAASNDNQGRVDATAWLLASELAILRVRSIEGLDAAAIPAKRFELTSELFARLKSGPFAVFAGLASELREHNADVATQERIYALVNELVQEFRQPA